MNDTPKWPKKDNIHGPRITGDRVHISRGWNAAIDACIAAFEEWRKGRDSYKIQLEAWHKVFGTSQLSHAIARLEKAEGRVELDEENMAAFIGRLMENVAGNKRTPDYVFQKPLMPSHGVERLNTQQRQIHGVAKAICKHFGVRRELEELDMSRVTKLVRKFTDCDIDDKRCLLDREEIRILQSSGVRKVPTVEEIKKTMIRAKHGEAAFTTTKYKMDVLRKQAEAVHRLITEGYVHEAEEG